MTTAAEPVPGFAHEGFFYRDAEGFTTGAGEFVRAGLAAGEVVVVAEPRPRLDQLRSALGPAGDAVTWLDMAEVGGNPARIIDVWADALARATAQGRQLRGVGEPAYAGRRPAELVECGLHERLLNRAFGSGPAWRLLCPYDEARLPAEVCAHARTTHPHAGPDDAGDRAALAAALPPPPGAVLRGGYRAGDLPAVRRTVRSWARSCGLPRDRVEDLELIAAELASNGIRHAGGGGTVGMWVADGAAVLEFSDAGRLAEPLTGRLRPAPDATGGRGLYLVNQLADLVQLRSSDAGTTVRVLTWL
ncbi:anti-sigma factor RsbA family regulatory protein [Blastococcus sp. SYSU D00669]